MPRTKKRVAARKDKIFSKKMKVGDFNFNKEVSDVFDDMLERSVPFYSELQDIMAEIASYFIQKNSNIYDLGCSTGNTLLSLMDAIKEPSVKFIGVDYSPSMLEKTKIKFDSIAKKRRYSLLEGDLNKMNFELSNASVVVMNWTFQFVRPLYRHKLLKKIYDGLRKNGVIILCEKVLVDSSLLNRLYIELYYNFKKKRGYSELEIAKKREALENVLIPYRVDENMQLLKSSGFKDVDMLFKWYNWASFVGIKKK
ncbi:MAG: carboxy-S-adenosyl-L-methionine synthase CmoA [Candidatus Omnitrophica bacterium]|nr:carboxy-S-adenosyl-L-methionine synthase CmoA [Candidatus Omnitrophota bacterium]